MFLNPRRTRLGVSAVPGRVVFSQGLAALVGCERECEAELGVGCDDEPGPPVRSPSCH